MVKSKKEINHWRKSLLEAETKGGFHCLVSLRSRREEGRGGSTGFTVGREKQGSHHTGHAKENLASATPHLFNNTLTERHFDTEAKLINDLYGLWEATEMLAHYVICVGKNMRMPLLKRCILVYTQ
jgi:hypothetical protein